MKNETFLFLIGEWIVNIKHAIKWLDSFTVDNRDSIENIF